MFGRACVVSAIALFAIWGGQKADEHFWPKQVTYENAPLVPEYELRRQQEEAWSKRVLRFGFV